MPIVVYIYIVHDVSDAKKMPCRMGQMSQMSPAHPEIVGGLLLPASSHRLAQKNWHSGRELLPVV